MTGRVAAAMALWGLLASAALAQAPPAAKGKPSAEAPQTATLSWVRLDGAEHCIGTIDLARAVERLLGRRVWMPPTQATLTVEGWIAPRRGGRGFEAYVRLDDADGRVLGHRLVRTESEGCHSLDSALALIIALTVDPGRDVAMAGAIGLRSATPTKPPPALDVPPEGNPYPRPLASAIVQSSVEGPEELGRPWAPVEPGPGRERAPTPGSSSRSTLEGRLLIGGGRTPGVDVGVSFGGWGMPARLPLAWSVRAWAPGTARAAQGRVRFWRLDLALAACPLHRRLSDVTLGMCGGLDLGMTVASPSGFDRNFRRLDMDVAPRVELRGDFWIGDRAGLAWSIAADAPLPRHHYTYVDDGGDEHVVWEPTHVRGWVAVGVAFRP